MKRIIIIVIMLFALATFSALADGPVKVELEGEALINSYNKLHISAPGADTCLVEWFDEAGRRTHDTEMELENGEGILYSFVAADKDMELIRVTAEIDGQTYSDSVWLYYGYKGAYTGSKPTILSTAPVQAGKPYTLRWKSVPDAQRYVVYAGYSNSNDVVGNEYNIENEDISEFSMTISEKDLTWYGLDSQYTFKVLALVPGYGPVTDEKTVSLSTAGDQGITISASKTNFQVEEEINITVSAPGAEKVAIVTDMYGEEEFDGDTHTEPYSWHTSRNTRVYAKACFNGQWTLVSSVLTLNATATGQVPAPIFAYKAELELGDSFNMSIKPVEHQGYDWAKVVISKIDNNKIVFNNWVEIGINAPFVPELFTELGRYSIQATVYGEIGWEPYTVFGEFWVKEPVPAGYSNSCGENVYWKLENGTLTITGSGDMFSYYDVCNGPWNAADVKALVVESGITKIGGYAFSGCTNLTSVSLPDTVKRIGQYAFTNCSALPGITVPSSVTTIGMHAFEGCSALRSISLPSGISKISSFSFAGCSSLTSVALPSRLAEISPKAFLFCKKLPSIQIPGTVISIGDSAFYGCSALHTLTLPSSVKRITFNAFDYSAIKAIYFYTNPALADWAMAGDLPAFALDSDILRIPADVTVIESEAFANLGRRVIVEIPATVTTIAPDAFDGSTVAFRCQSGSAAARYAAANDIPIAPN